MSVQTLKVLILYFHILIGCSFNEEGSFCYKLEPDCKYANNAKRCLEMVEVDCMYKDE